MEVGKLEAAQQPTDQVGHQQVDHENAHQVPRPQAALGEWHQFRQGRPKVGQSGGRVQLPAPDREIEQQARPHYAQQSSQQTQGQQRPQRRQRLCSGPRVIVRCLSGVSLGSV